ETARTKVLTVRDGTNDTALVPIITHTGANISPNTGVAQDFTSPVIYTVTAADSTTKTYTVTVTVAANPAKAITSFNFNGLTPNRSEERRVEKEKTKQIETNEKKT